MADRLGGVDIGTLLEQRGDLDAVVLLRGVGQRAGWLGTHRTAGEQ